MRGTLILLAVLLGVSGPVWAQTSDEDASDRVRVVRPSAAPGAELVDGTAAESGDATADEENMTPWQRARARRFKRAPRYQGEIETGSAATAPLAPIAPIETDFRKGAVLRSLDKMTGATRTFEMVAGSEARADRLKVSVSACRAPEDASSRGTMAFLKIWDQKYPDAPPVFSGWMFADSPALSALDHPRYDLWVISCTTDAPEQSAASE